MNWVFKDYSCKFMLVFFDNILIYSSDWNERLLHLQIVFNSLKTNQLQVKVEKGKFEREVQY